MEISLNYKRECITRGNDLENRFNFNALVTGYFMTDQDEEAEIQILLKNVSLCSGGDIIGTESYKVYEALKEQHPELSEKEVNRVMLYFECNSETNDNNFDYVALKPDKVLQCTGLKSSGILLYEGDIVYLRGEKCIIKYINGHLSVHNLNTLKCLGLTADLLDKLELKIV